MNGGGTSTLPRCIGAVIYVAAFFHLTVLFLAGMPHNPIKVAATPFLSAYSSTLFPQSWSFFAPNPARTTVAILARPVDGRPDGSWRDVSSELARAVYSNRFTSDALMLEVLTHASQPLGRRPAAVEAREAVENVAYCVLKRSTVLRSGDPIVMRLDVYALSKWSSSRRIVRTREWATRPLDVTC